MIESLKELVGLIKELPGMALWILGGFLFYKLFIIGSVYGVIRLAITRTHDWLLKPKEPQVKIEAVTINEKFITTDGTHKYFLDVLDKARRFRYKLKKGYKTGKIGKIEDLLSDSYMLNYLHKNDVEWIEQAIEDKYEKDKTEARV